MSYIYEYCVKVLNKAQAQGKPEFALSSKELRALRYLQTFNRNFEPVRTQPLEH